MKPYQSVPFSESWRLPLEVSLELRRQIKQAEQTAVQPGEHAAAAAFSSEDYPLPINRGYKVVEYGNLVYGARASNWCSTPLVGAGAKPRILIPYQFSGVVTAPADAPKPVPRPRFFGGIFESFFRFVLFPVALAQMAWQALRDFICGSADPQNATRARQSEDVIKDIKDRIEIEQNASGPLEILPLDILSNASQPKWTQAGAGIFFERVGEPNYLYQCADPERRVSSTINSTDPQWGWVLPADAVRFHFTWLSRDHRVNDGDAYGSVLILEQQ